MKSKLLMGSIKTLDRNLRKNSWGNYQLFLEGVLKSCPTDRSLVGLRHLRDKDFQGLLMWADGLANEDYSSPGEHRLYRQLAALVRKYPFPEGSVRTDPEGEATRKFVAAEQKCHRINQRFACYRKVRSPHELVLNRARNWISYVLGDLKLAEVWEQCAFGAGASLGVHGNATNLARKLLSKDWTVSPGAYSYARAALKEDVHMMELLNEDPSRTPYFSADPDLFNRRFASKARMVGYNKISFVPKDAMTHRAIATEPLLNGYIQKGVDLVMRKRLKRVGIDLNDQTRNQKWARIGSRLGSSPDGLATIDLSSASDSISIELCRFLLPPDWFDFLSAIRSHSYLFQGTVKTYQKFTSMGNGFCFPLESLIFASLCHASHSDKTPKTDFLVYGDDIIVSSVIFEPLIELLTICGFKVNPKKTFAKGPFRESCGADWFEGEDVRPIILDYTFDSLESIFKFCNGSRSKENWKVLLGEGLEFLEGLIPPNCRLVRPFKGNPETALEVPWDVFLSSPFSRYRLATYSWSWVEIVKAATPDKQVLARTGYNVALMAGALRGVQSSCPFTERYSARTNVRRVSHHTGGSTFLPGGSASSLGVSQLNLYRQTYGAP